MPTLFESQKQFITSLNTEKNETIIYLNSIIGSLQKTLKEIYPVCEKLVGEDFFLAMTKNYIAITPSLSPDLADYGESFANFIEYFQPAKSLPYLADVTRLEWAIHRVFGASESGRIELQQLAARFAESGEELLFSLPNNSFLLTSPYPIYTIWQMNQNNSSDLETLYLSDTQQITYLFVWRCDLEIQIDVLDFAEWQMLSLIQSGLTLGEISDKTTLEILPDIIKRGWICSFN